MSDTPRTDAAAFEVAGLNCEGQPYEDSDGRSVVVTVEFARQLERELQAALAQIESPKRHGYR